MRLAGKSHLIAALMLVLWTAPAIAQGCAMCRANAKATPKEGQRAIDRAILLMIVPPISAVTVGTTLIVRYARRRDRENEDGSTQNPQYLNPCHSEPAQSGGEEPAVRAPRIHIPIPYNRKIR